MNRTLASLALLVALGSFGVGCDATDGDGDGEGGGDAVDTDEAASDDADADDDDDHADDADDEGHAALPGASPPVECDPATRPTDCLYDVVVCDAGEWGCGDTPLVLSFDGAEPTFDSACDAGFDLTGHGLSHTSDWPTARTPWLALDRDGDGRITSGAELFGSAVTLASGERAANGFEALAELDADGNGRIDANDPGFANLVLWSDDGDRVSQANELTSAGARRIESIELSYRRARVCDTRGNCGVERASFTWLDEVGVRHTGTVIDVHLPKR